MDFVKNDIPEMISVKSIRTVYSLDLSGKPPTGDVHDFPELIYVSQGRHMILVDGEPVTLSCGEMMVYAPNAYHIGAEPCDVSVYIISFDSDSEALRTLYNRPAVLTEKQKDALCGIVFSALPLFEPVPDGSTVHGMMLKSGTSDLELQKLKKNLELFLIDVICSEQTPQQLHGNQTPVRRKQLYREICGYLENNLCRPVPLDEVTAYFGIGRSTLTALFRSECGMGVTAYFNRRKIEETKRLIREKNMNFTEIAEAVGFSSVHYFSRLFKAITGMTPSEYAGKYRQSGQ